MLYFARWKVILIWATVVVSVLAALPNLFTKEQLAKLPSWMPTRQISLGLDLQGGASMLMEVDMTSVKKERLENLVDSVRGALRENNVGYTGLGSDGNRIMVTVSDPAQADKAARLVTGLGHASSGLMVSGAPLLEVVKGENGRLSITLTAEALADIQRTTVGQSMEIVRRRVDEMGTKETSIQREGADRILLQMPGVQNTDEIKRILGKTAKMQFRFVDESMSPAEAARTHAPAGSEVLPLVDSTARGEQSVLVKKRVMVSGETLVDAQASFQEGAPVVSFKFDTLGGKKFADATRDNIGRRFAIVLDNKVISAPVIQSAILGGSGIISGNFTVQTANELALLLRAGALPAPLVILEERSVGAELGADSIRGGIIAAITGLTMILVFMVITYGWFGVTAVTTLIVNKIMIIGAMSLLGATLTMPGIAGIVLTIGMAVDGNVLINERIREELRAGKSNFAAIDAGYSRAFSTIMDANICTLLVAAILFMVGTGPVKGFAVTLTAGIITSVFTTVTLSRLIIVSFVRRLKPVALSV